MGDGMRASSYFEMPSRASRPHRRCKSTSKTSKICRENREISYAREHDYALFLLAPTLRVCDIERYKLRL